MKLLFTPEALASYNKLKDTSPKEAESIKDILQDIVSHPETGKGSPKALTGLLSGLWSRQYAFHRQIVYQISSYEIKVYAISVDSLPGEASSSPDFQQTSYSEEEYRSVLAQMSANRGKEDTPKVGISGTA